MSVTAGASGEKIQPEGREEVAGYARKADFPRGVALQCVRIRMDENFVDLHTSWEESGTWVSGLESEEFDEATFNLGVQTGGSSDEMTLVLGVADPRALTVLAGTSFTSIESYAMVNGTVRTPPMSGEGEPVEAFGEVDCGLGVMTLLDAGPGAGEFTMNKIG